MQSVFLKMLNMSIAAGYGILAVLILRFALKNAPKSLRLILWGLVGVRLIFPFSIKSVLSLVPSVSTIQYAGSGTVPVVTSGFPALNSAVNPAIAASMSPAPYLSADPAQALLAIWSSIWVAGAALMLLYAVVSYFRLRHRVNTAVRLYDDVFESEAVKTPFVLGLFRPRVYLPFYMEEPAKSLVIAHERAHIRQGDHWIKLLGFALLAVYWFHPLVWVANILLCRDLELCCDERVIATLDLEEKKAYSNALLSCGAPSFHVSACPVAFGEVGIKARIQNILNYKKPAFWAIVLGVMACVVLAVCFLTDPVPPTKEAELSAAGLGQEDAIAPEAEYGLIYCGADGVVQATMSPLSGEEETLVQDIFMDFLVRSAAFEAPGNPKEHEHLIIRQTFVKTDEVHDYYVYQVDGLAVIQPEKGNMYTRISNRLYSELLEVMGIPVPDISVYVDALIEAICSSPEMASNPEAYLDAHPEEYGKLLRYEDRLVEYCFKKFEAGGQTGLHGQIMARACQEILGLPKDGYETGQAWYDAY